MPLPLLFVLFIITFIIMGFMGWVFYMMARSTDTRTDSSILSHNQWRLVGWAVAIGIVMIAVVIEFFVIVR